ncbi:heparin-sulfate lyase HepC [Paraflavisolibacter sp. H34]|uniref:heparin-sulfate lyase HepC n=1 Tax=Huijunlia imazamoxiresistens TaxID=3127457 RepID=UPI0030183D82
MITKLTQAILIVLLLCSRATAQDGRPGKESFNPINLDYPGLEQVKRSVVAGAYDKAAEALLAYYRGRTGIRHPEFNWGERRRFAGKPIGAADRQKADSALVHKFQPHKGYGFFDYGRDIDWQLWPVKDNEVRWQLHRVKWWQSLGLAYRSSGDEKYAREWVFQFGDWVKKNPLGLSADNDSFAWRPLEISDRIQSLSGTFQLFLGSPQFSGAFLLQFLNSYHQQADYLNGHFAQKGNHRLFEAQRVLLAGAFFPEFQNAARWRKHGIEVLNTEIKKQVYPDGVQFELSPAYQVASIEIFLKAYQAAQMAGAEKEFPRSYRATVEKMVEATLNMSFPDYQVPMFGDAWQVEQPVRLRQFRSWAEAFPHNSALKYFATEGRQGTPPPYLSKGLTTAGFYTFRNGWDPKATVLVLKASPPGAFHAQPDNGTFELWVKGRNFTPDAGVYVYSGDAEVMKLREAYRQTRVHNTLTLDNRNMAITNARLEHWDPTPGREVLTYTNPSYPGLDHRRSLLFIDQKYFLLIDEARGAATGRVGVHFHLKEDSRAVFDTAGRSVHTNYPDGNNLLVQSLNGDPLSLAAETSKVSYSYRKELERPALVFEKPKADSRPQVFLTLLYPYEGAHPPRVSVQENEGNDWRRGRLRLTLHINGKQQPVNVQLAP